MAVDRRQSNFSRDFLLGGAVFGASRTIAAPLERVRLLQQVEGELHRQSRLGGAPYASTLDCARRTVLSDGFAGLFRGNTCQVLRFFPAKGFTLAFKKSFDDAFVFERRHGYPLFYAGRLLSGGLSACAALLLLQPFDYCRTRLAADVRAAAAEGHHRRHPRQFSGGSLGVLRASIASDGLLGVYRGTVVGLSCAFIKQGLYFGLFDIFFPLLPKPARCTTSGAHSSDGEPFYRDPRQLINALTLGWGCTVVAAYLAHPFDTVRRRMMMTTGAPEALRYTGAIQCFIRIVKNEGGGAVWKGANMHLLSGFVGAASLVALEAASQKYLRSIAAGARTP